MSGSGSASGKPIRMPDAVLPSSGGEPQPTGAVVRRAGHRRRARATPAADPQPSSSSDPAQAQARLRRPPRRRPALLDYLLGGEWLVRRGRRSSSIAANPVLIGAATVLVILVAVFLAYNANNGLPFVPTYQLKVDVPNAANLVRGNDVRVGGTRVGAVSDIVPKRGKDGTYYAQLDVKLQRSVDPLPKDSTFLVRPRSALGLKYVQITKGTSDDGWSDGATVSLAQAKPEPVEIDQVLNMFDEQTRQASQVNLNEFGLALAGRGQDLNVAIEELNPLLKNLVPVMQNLSDNRTRGSGGCFQALERAASIVAPAARDAGRPVRQPRHDVLRAVRRARRHPGLDRGRPGGARRGDRGLPAPAPVPGQLAGALPRAAARRARAAHRRPDPGRRLRGRHPHAAAHRRAQPAADEHLQLARCLRRGPEHEARHRRPADTSDILRPTIAYLKPTQTVCNYMTLWFRNIASLLSDGDANGTWQRFIIVAAPQGPNNEGGPRVQARRRAQRRQLPAHEPVPEHERARPAGECEAGNEEYLPGRTVIGNVPGTQSQTTQKTKASLTD